MNKCHYDKDVFVPCDQLKQNLFRLSIKFIDYAKYRIDHDLEICDFCGESLKKPESDRPWWAIVGMCVKTKETNDVGKITNISVHGVEIDHGLNWDIDEIKPIGGPFDMIPEWATYIYFSPAGSGDFRDSRYILKETVLLDFPIWHNCPEEFKGKTFSLKGLK